MRKPFDILIRLPLLITVFAAACSSTPESASRAQTDSSIQQSQPRPPEPDVKTIIQGQKLSISPGITLTADDRTPLVVMHSSFEKHNYSSELELTNQVVLWDGGIERTFTLLGLDTDAQVNGRTYAVRVTEKLTPKALFPSTIVGNYSLNGPVRIRGGNISGISKEPLVFYVSASMYGDRQIELITTFGAKTIDGQKLGPKASKFKKDTGEIITAKYSEKINDFDLPDSARGHGHWIGPADGESSVDSKIGPANIKLARSYPFNGQTTAILSTSNVSNYSGPLLMKFTLADTSFSSAIPKYVPPGTAFDEHSRQSTHDSNFSERWKLTLDPPILVEHGLGPQGVLNGPAVLDFHVWKFGKALYGTAGYIYSDCGLTGGGTVTGSVEGERMELKVTGAPSMVLHARSVRPDEIKGLVKIFGTIPGGGYISQPEGEERKFILTAVNPQPSDEFKRSSSESYSMCKFSDLEKQVKDKDYWDALTMRPGAQYRDSLALSTERMALAEQSNNPSAISNQASDLAHLHYCAWKLSKAELGAKHPLTLAHRRIAELLYKRLDAKESQRRSTGQNNAKMREMAEAK